MTDPLPADTTPPRPPAPLTAVQIVRVLETPLGRAWGAYADDQDVERERSTIYARYQELSRRTDFTNSSLQARAEWLDRLLDVDGGQGSP